MEVEGVTRAKGKKLRNEGQSYQHSGVKGGGGEGTKEEGVSRERVEKD
jgi:hypothetical protein